MESDPFAQLAAFPKREATLRAILRYHIYPVMYYRTSLWNHSRRVLWLVEEALPYVRNQSFDPVRARLLALVHDDAEIITGDVQAAHKSKMSEAQLKDVDSQEDIAIKKLAARFPRLLGPYCYADLLREILVRETPEAHLVVLADKIDGFMEALHEAYAGNVCFVTRLRDENFGELPLPYEYYLDYLADIGKRYPDIGKLSQTDCWLARTPPPDPGFS